METKIQFHLGNPELIQIPPAETCAFNERIQKIVVNVDDLLEEEEREDSENTMLGIMDVEQEEERERMRREEEVHPNEVKDQSLV